MEVAPNYLKEVVAPLMDPRVGMVTCVYRGKNAAGFWSGLTALGMSVEMTAGVLVANLFEGIKFGLGPTIAVKKEALRTIGGYEVLGHYFANDYMIGNLIAKAGYGVVLSQHAIDHVVNQQIFRKMWENQLRWAKSTRYSRPKGHLGSGLIYAMPYGVLGLLSAAVRGNAAGARFCAVRRGGCESDGGVVARWMEGRWGSGGKETICGFSRSAICWASSFGPRVIRRHDPYGVEDRYELKGDKIALREKEGTAVAAH